MIRSLRVAVAFTPGCALLAAALVVGSNAAPRAARGAAELRAPLVSAMHRAAPPARRVSFVRDPFAPPPGMPDDDRPPSFVRAATPYRGAGALPMPPDVVPGLRAVVVGTHAMALLELQGRTMVARQGDTAGAWRVVAIEAAGVRLARNGAELTLRVEDGP